MLKIFLKLLLACLFIPGSVKCIERDSIEVIINQSIQYLVKSQIPENCQSPCYAGEWPSYIENIKPIPFLGPKGKSAYDSNGFNTLFIHNMLAEIYLQDSSYNELLPVLRLARANFLRYKNGHTFNFWPELERRGNLRCRHEGSGCRQRGPRFFEYRHQFIRNYANIYDDADDTAAGFIAMALSDSIFNNDPKARSFDIKDTIGKVFERYRDLGKRKTNWYNKTTGFNYRTGAYLTWFGPEWERSNFFRWFFPDHHKQNILYGVNEVDCVVNANVLGCFAFFGMHDVAGISNATSFLGSALNERTCQTCAVYYPSEFSFHYALAKAISSGAKTLEPFRSVIIDQVIEAIEPDGSCRSVVTANELQVTLYALNTLLLIGDPTSDIVKTHVERAMGFVLNSRYSAHNMSYWPGGIFFSGGSAIRYQHVWRSDAYTTALALEALVNYLHSYRS